MEKWKYAGEEDSIHWFLPRYVYLSWLPWSLVPWSTFPVFHPYLFSIASAVGTNQSLQTLRRLKHKPGMLSVLLWSKGEWKRHFGKQIEFPLHCPPHPFSSIPRSSLCLCLYPCDNLSAQWCCVYPSRSWSSLSMIYPFLYPYQSRKNNAESTGSLAVLHFYDHVIFCLYLAPSNACALTCR